MYTWYSHVTYCVYNVISISLIFISCSILYSFSVIRTFSQNVLVGMFGCWGCLLCSISWYITCYFANLVPEETRRLHRDIASSYRPFFKADVITFMRSVRTGYVQDGSFRAIERESFLIFIGFVVNQLVALLLI